jgi:hypothetical protein
VKIPRLFIATPAYAGQLHTTYVQSLLTLITSLTATARTPKLLFVSNESLITRARNECVGAFMSSDCDVLAFIDGDIGFDAQDIIDMVTAGFDVVGGACPLKTQDGSPRFVFNTPPNAPIVDVRGKRYQRCLDLGTGMMFITRRTIEHIIAMFGSETRYVNDAGETRYDIFSVGVDPTAPPESRRYLSEDYLFCRFAQIAGFKVFVSLDAKITHTGPRTWHGDIAATIANATAARERAAAIAAATSGAALAAREL